MEIQFNPDVEKQDNELVCLRKLEKEVHPQINFNNSSVVKFNFLTPKV